MTPGPIDLPHRHLFDFDFIDAADVDSVVSALVSEQPDDGRLPVVATPNVDDIVRLRRPEFADLNDLTKRARYLLPDGQPVIWASRLLGQPLTARLTGADLLPVWWAALKSAQRPVIVVAPHPSVAAILEQSYSGVHSVIAPRFDISGTRGIEQVADRVADHMTALEFPTVMFGIGFPHQQRLALSVFDRHPDTSSLIALLGGSFDLFTGHTRRAPNWMRHHGLEWLYRLGTEPRRLARRYLVDDLAFAPLVWGSWRSQSRTPVRLSEVTA